MEAFEKFAANVNKGGLLVLKDGLRLENRTVSGYYAVGKKTDYYVDNLRPDNGCYIFDYHGKKGDIRDIKLGIPGRLNVENATAAITLALEAGARRMKSENRFPASGVWRGASTFMSITERLCILTITRIIRARLKRP